MKGKANRRKWRNAMLAFALGLATLPLFGLVWPFLFAAWVWQETE